MAQKRRFGWRCASIMARAGFAFVVLLILGAVVTGEARAETKFDMPAEYRFHIHWLDDFPVDDTGRDLDRNPG